ncbi:MAG: beta-hydroxyacyl-ACP dehydratase [Sedimentisphaerales bacterium]|nr:beta-hydroxyacyl-ACP dehydratase [Sedimentisphaerales bacterium]
MPPTLLLNLDEIDLSNIAYDVDAIEKVNPHRFEMRQIDAIVHLDVEQGVILGYKDVTEDEFWVRGHIPGRPLMPGVLMIEAAAQMASILAKVVSGEERFIGFGGIEDVKFRGQVSPGKRLYLLGKFIENRPRRFKMAAQGVVDNQLVFEGMVIGMPM